MTVPSYTVSTGTGTADGGATTITSGSITPSGSNRFALIHVENSDGSVANCTGVTLNGNACTQIGTNQVLPGTFWNQSLWRYTGPAASSMTATATFAASQTERLIQVICFQDVDQTTPIGTPVQTTSASGPITASNIGSAVDDLLVTACCMGAGSTPDTRTLVPGNSQTERIETKTTPTGYDYAAVATLTATGTSTSLSWDTDSPGDPDPDGGFGIFGVAIKQVSGGGGGGGKPWNHYAGMMGA